MELMIDNRPCDLGTAGCAVPGYDAARLSDPDASRKGRALQIVVPRTAGNDRIFSDAADPHAAVRFNDSRHTASLTLEGAVLLGGSVRLLGCADDGYRIEIRDGGAGWAENAARRMFNTLGVEWSGILAPTTIVESWTSDEPVKFFPILRDEYEQQNSSTDLLRPRGCSPWTTTTRSFRLQPSCRHSFPKRATPLKAIF